MLNSVFIVNWRCINVYYSNNDFGKDCMINDDGLPIYTKDDTKNRQCIGKLCSYWTKKWLNSSTQENFLPKSTANCVRNSGHYWLVELQLPNLNETILLSTEDILYSGRTSHVSFIRKGILTDCSSTGTKIYRYIELNCVQISNTTMASSCKIYVLITLLIRN